MKTTTRAFTLIELLSVIGTIVLLGSLSGPAIQALAGAGSLEKAATDLSLTLQSARAYALANNTYVRVAVAEAAGSGARLVAVTLYSADGTTQGNMDSNTAWPMLTKPLALQNLTTNKALNGSLVDTRGDDRPDDSDMAMERTLEGYGLLEFKSCIEFSPTGEAGILSRTSSRFIAIGCDRPAGDPRAGKNPFLLRLSGTTGAIATLRKEDLL